MSGSKKISQLNSATTVQDTDIIPVVSGGVTKKTTKADLLKEINAKADGHIADIENPHDVTKAQVGLGNVDNTADADKPISEATQGALDDKADETDLTTHTGNTSNPHGVTKAQVGLGNADNTSDANKPVSSATQTALDAKASASTVSTHIANKTNPHEVTKTQVGLGNVTDDAQVKRSEMGQPSGVATLGTDGKVPNAQIPALAIGETFVVVSEVAMLALDAQKGDVAIRSDESKTYILSTDVPTVLANWKQILVPASPVQSVAGKTGIVVLAKADVGLGNVDNTTDANKPVSTAQDVAFMKILDYTIPSKNLFDKRVATVGYYVLESTGELNPGIAGYFASDFIPVLPNTAYCHDAGATNHNAYYTSSKVYISGCPAGTFTTPANAYYVRISQQNIDTCQLELGAVPTSYLPFTVGLIPKDKIKDIPDGSVTTPKIADNSITKAKILDGVVSASKVSFLRTGNNLFNNLDPDIVMGYYISAYTGLTAINANYNATGYIKIVGGATYTMSYKLQIAWYDINKVYISGSYTDDPGLTKTAPSNAVYLRCSVALASWSTFMVNIGSSLLPFELFKYILLGINNEPIETPLLDGACTTVKLADGAVTTPKIADSNVTPQKVNFLQPGTNLFNPLASDISTGYYVAYATGKLSANAGYNATGYIPVVAGQSYTMSFKHQMAWYNSAKVYISGSSSTDTNKTQVAPAGACFYRSSVAVSVWSTFIFSRGTVDIPYEAFGYVLRGVNNEPIKTPGADPVTLNTPEFAMPAKHYLLGGYENNLYFQSLMSRWQPYNYIPRLDSGNFLNYSTLARLTSPTVETTAVLKLYDNYDLALKRSQNVQILIGPASANNGSLRIIGIGDSYTYNGSWLKKVKALCPAVTFDGMRVPYGDATITAEGRGGWTLAGYFTNIHSGNTDSFSPFMQPPNPYKYYGNTAFWIASLANSGDYGISGFNAKAIALGFDAGTGLKTSPATNDMMWNDVNARLEVWDGSAWVTTTVTTGDFTFNFAKYRSTFVIGQPDIVPILLGLNDFRSQADKATVDTLFVTWKSRMETLITSVHADSPNAKVVILLPTTYCANMDNSGGNFTIMQNQLMWEARKLMITNFDAREAEKIYVVECGGALDPEYGFAYTADKPFSDYSGTETRKVQGNSPHPSTEGYYQLGVPLAGFIQKTR